MNASFSQSVTEEGTRNEKERKKVKGLTKDQSVEVDLGLLSSTKTM